MKAIFAIGYLMIVVVLVLALVGSSKASSAAMPLLGFTDTPTATSDATTVPRDTLTPTNTPEPSPQDTPEPGPKDTPVPPAETPVGTLTLPFTGENTTTPLWLLLAIAGGLLAFGAHLLRRSARSF